MTSRDRIASMVRDGVDGRPALALAPMATITHAGFRILVHEFGGCDLYFTEMISAEALLGGTEFEVYYRSLQPVPESTIYQIIGYSHATILMAAERLVREPCAGIDINLGCSAPHIVRRGGGAAWVSDPEATIGLISDLRRLMPEKSLSVKLRLGREDDPGALLAITRGIQDAGADFVTLHPKRQRDGEARVARWEYVDLVSRELSIPVIGNGGIVDWSSYQARRGSETRRRTNALMIGRGAVRAPWIFAYLRGREAGDAGLEANVAETARRFLALLEEHQPSSFWPSRARRVYPYLFKNLRFGHSIGARLAGCHDYEAGKLLMNGYFAEHPEVCVHRESA